MMYFRCKCGKREAWASYFLPACDGCNECKTTLEMSSGDHEPLAEHDWMIMYDEYTGKPYKRCRKCMQTDGSIEQVQIQG